MSTWQTPRADYMQFACLKTADISQVIFHTELMQFCPRFADKLHAICRQKTRICRQKYSQFLANIPEIAGYLL